MDPNAIEIKRVYTREKGELVPDQTISNGDTNQIVIEWAAGATANANLGPGTPVDEQLVLEVITHDVTATGIAAAPLTVSPGVNVLTDGEARNGIYEWLSDDVGPGAPLAEDKTFEITARLYRPPSTVSFYKWMFFVTA